MCMEIKYKLGHTVSTLGQVRNNVIAAHGDDVDTLIATGMKVAPDEETISKIEEIAGKGTVVLS